MHVYRTIANPKSRVEIVCVEQVVGVYACQAMITLMNAMWSCEKQASEASYLHLCRVLKWPDRGNPYHALHFFFNITSGGELGYVTVDGALERSRSLEPDLVGDDV
ncbi:hypothetical protein DY000_02009814 [Brassica cretica]|uniref:Uncharacterized protein n=1 Tax=Brassica cretica TaxID=69181 RepID=A0ABQ7C7P4_BRACR|nr:hypothetical protein DY000_02009814 [Brassica cretica]